jgi:hypothetical protein
MREHKRNALILPDVLEESILADNAGLEFLSSHHRVVDFATESMLEVAHGFGERIRWWSSDKKKVDIACGVLLVARE